MEHSKNVHVVKNKNSSGWVTKVNGSVKTTHRTQANAIKSGKEIAKDNHSELVTHGADGKIRSKDSFGKDPNPPRDTEH